MNPRLTKSWWLEVEPKEKTPDDMRVRSEEESNDLPLFAEKSKRPTTSKSTGKHNVFTLVPKDPDCEVWKITKTTRAPFTKRQDERRDRIQLPQNFGDAMTADHKVLNEENESR